MVRESSTSGWCDVLRLAAVVCTALAFSLALQATGIGLAAAAWVVVFCVLSCVGFIVATSEHAMRWIGLRRLLSPTQYWDSDNDE